MSKTYSCTVCGAYLKHERNDKFRFGFGTVNGIINQGDSYGIKNTRDVIR